MAKAATKTEEIVTETKPKEALFCVVLNKHHCPAGAYEIVGYLKPKVERKDSTGKMIMVEPEQFVEGEMHPAPLPGTGFPNKIWAGTHIKLPVDEARRLVAAKLADRADAIAA